MRGRGYVCVEGGMCVLKGYVCVVEGMCVWRGWVVCDMYVCGRCMCLCVEEGICACGEVCEFDCVCVYAGRVYVLVGICVHW